MLCSLLLLDFFAFRNLRGLAERHIFPELIFRGNHFVPRRSFWHPLLLTWLLLLLLVLSHWCRIRRKEVVVAIGDDRDSHMYRDAIEDLRGEIRYHPYQDIVEKEGQEGHSPKQEIGHLLFLFRFILTYCSTPCLHKLLNRCDGHESQS